MKEEKLIAMIKGLLWQFKFMWTDEKVVIVSAIVFLIAEKLLNLWLQTFRLFLLTVLLKIKCNCMSGLFFYCIFFGDG